MADLGDSAGAAGGPHRRPRLRLTPGKVIAGRYRIVARVGGGGMGEVYRADDTSIGRYVALKFPPASTDDPSWSWRLAAEVEMAQSVSHPNVCRVHELGRHGGHVFVSMAFIDGESLRRVLSRSVGVLTHDEKLRIAHDLCAGLAAIHDQRVLHRDLKPDNVMLDGSGRAVITDFGIASYAGAVTDRRSGTLAYTAPEILAGELPTQHSDVYSLCLVLYELFAGRPPFPAQPVEERLRLQRAGAPALPDPDGVDPAVREAIARGLAPEPEERFATAAELAAALPQRPELAAAPRGGRSVAPETLLVAPRLGVRRAAAWGLAVAILFALPLVALLTAAVQPGRAAAAGEPPAALAGRAREILRRLGFEEPAEDSLHGYVFEAAGAARGEATERPAGSPPSPLRFWYRQSRGRLVPLNLGSLFSSYDDPPLPAAGAVGVHLDPTGRLLRLDASPERRELRRLAAEPDWEALFAAAGLDLAGFRDVPPSWIPPGFAARRRAWVGRRPDREGGSIRVEAAAFRGQVVGFRVFGEAPPGAAASKGPGRSASAVGTLLLPLWFFAGLIAAVLLASRNLRRRTADRPAAFRVATVVLIARIVAWLLGSGQRISADIVAAQAGLARALLTATLVWIFYVALEPTIRALWPRHAASWVRLLYGRWRDPLVGRDLLLGVAFGLAALFWAQLYVAAPGWLGVPPPPAGSQNPLLWQIGRGSVEILCESLASPARALAMGIYAVVRAVVVALFGVMGVALLRLLLVRAWLSRTVAALLLTFLMLPAGGHPAAAVVAAAVSSALWLTILVRFGFLPVVVATVVAGLVGSLPMPFPPAGWTLGVSACTLLAVLGVTVWGFVAALGGRPALDRRLPL
ncbi:MAG: serine/threonine protein kinase [Acidobacteriota bacterium]|nr:serine/threonine protein kinase [Acidobacteriota bacterium]MDH3523559.1 serine/threonine protein kinase [Acidobacteriota bacterium]